MQLFSGRDEADHDLEQRRERPGLCLHASRDERLPAAWEDDDITGLEVRRGVLEEAEVVA
jgi:hypothetical protein